MKEKKNLKGDGLKAKVDKKSWDDSIKALTATPSVLDMMSDKLDWTKSLGDAMLAQQADLMDAVLRLRDKAKANNKLSSNKQQKVTVKQQESKQVIVIGPTDCRKLAENFSDVRLSPEKDCEPLRRRHSLRRLRSHFGRHSTL